ncbi:MAG: ShlB/FhaC/HecB family protein [Leptospirales bacterium]
MDGLIEAPTGTALETEALDLHVTPEPTFSGSQLEIDNYGYAPTGAVVLNATGTANNAGFAGGRFVVSASTSFGGMASGLLSYSAPVGLFFVAGGDLTAMNYTLGQGFSPWGHGTNTVALTALGVSGSNYSGDLWATEILSEKEDRKLALKETLFQKEFQDTYSPTVQNDRSLTGGSLDLSGYRSLGKIFASFDLSDTEYALVQGGGSSPQNPFYNSTPGLQNYLSANGQIQYSLTPDWSVTLGTIDQQYFGGGSLDPMLQATLGGMANVMALPTAALFGNNLYAVTLTLTRSTVVKVGTLGSSLFFDAGQVTGLGTNYAAMGPGVEESVSSAHWFARADLAVPVGGLPTATLGQTITALTGGTIGQGGIPLQLWLSAGLRY